MKSPAQFGKYYLLERINVGGMAEVYKAKTFGLEGYERTVAVKRILPAIAEDTGFISMFIDEARLAVQLNHANICQVFDIGKVDDSYFIAMEYVAGRDLRVIWDRCKQRPEGGQTTMPIIQACFIMMKVCEGLDYAHNKKDSLGHDLSLVHRDVSPQNIIVSYEGEVKLIDFGIAKAACQDQKTQAGILKGKYGYMSPEQVRGLEIDRRADVFAAGIVLYELITGERLFAGESDFSALEKIRNAEILPPTTYNRKIPEELEQIVMRALAREPDERYPTANDLHDDLQAFMYTSGEFCSRKELSTWMKRVFRGELDAEQQAQEAWKNFRPESGALEKDRRELIARANKITAGLPVVRASDAIVGSIGGSGVFKAPGGDKASSWTPPQSSAAPQSGPRKAQSAEKARANVPEPVEPDMTTVDGVQHSGKVKSDFRWEDEELETVVHDHPPLEEEAAPAPVRAAPRAAPAPVAVHDEPEIEAQPTLRADPKALEAAVANMMAVAQPVLPGVALPPPPAAPVKAPPPPPRPSPQPLLPVDEEAETKLALKTSPDMVTTLSAAAAIHTAPHAASPRTDEDPRPPAGRGLLYLGVTLGVLAILGVAVMLGMATRKGELILATDPASGGQLLVNQQPMEVPSWPARVILRPGTYQITVQRDGFVPWTQTVEVKAGDSLLRTARLETVAARTGGFTLLSEPPGAQVFLDGGELPQRTPMRVASVLPGEHRLELRLGARVLKHTFTVEVGKQPELRLLLPAAPEVAEAPRPAGEPAKEPKEPAKEPKEPAKEPREHREPKERKAVEERPRQAKGEGDATPKSAGREETAVGEGFLRVNSKPWTHIVVDGKDTGMTTPQPAMRLRAGTHQVTLQNPQFNVKTSFSVTIRPGETQTVVKNLQIAED